MYFNETSNRHFTIYYDVNEGKRFDYNIKDNPEIFESMLIRNDLIMLKCYYLDGVENGFFTSIINPIRRLDEILVHFEID